MTTTRDSFVEAVGMTAQQALRRAHFSLPGVIESFDRSTARADIYPAIDQLIEGEAGLELQPRPIVYDVPVVYPVSSVFSMTYPLSQGDPVLLIFSQRGLVDFKARLSQSTSLSNCRPDEKVFFSLKDAVAVPGFIRGSAAVPTQGVNFQTEAMTVNGNPMFSTEGPLIARGTLPTGALTQGDRVATTWSSLAAGWTAAASAIRAPVPLGAPLSSTGILVKMLRSNTETSRAVFAHGVSVEATGVADGRTTLNRRLLPFTRSAADGAVVDNQLICLESIRGDSSPLSYEIVTPLDPAPVQTLPGGLTVEVHWAWNGGVL